MHLTVHDAVLHALEDLPKPQNLPQKQQMRPRNTHIYPYLHSYQTAFRPNLPQQQQQQRNWSLQKRTVPQRSIPNSFYFNPYNQASLLPQYTSK